MSNLFCLFSSNKFLKMKFLEYEKRDKICHLNLYVVFSYVDWKSTFIFGTNSPHPLIRKCYKFEIRHLKGSEVINILIRDSLAISSDLAYTHTYNIYILKRLFKEMLVKILIIIYDEYDG